MDLCLGILQLESEISLAARLVGLKDDTWEVVSCRCRRLRPTLILGDKFLAGDLLASLAVHCDLTTPSGVAQPSSTKQSSTDASRGVMRIAGWPLCQSSGASLSGNGLNSPNVACVCVGEVDERYGC